MMVCYFGGLKGAKTYVLRLQVAILANMFLYVNTKTLFCFISEFSSIYKLLTLTLLFILLNSRRERWGIFKQLRHHQTIFQMI